MNYRDCRLNRLGTRRGTLAYTCCKMNGSAQYRQTTTSLIFSRSFRGPLAHGNGGRGGLHDPVRDGMEVSVCGGSTPGGIA